MRHTPRVKKGRKTRKVQKGGNTCTGPLTNFYGVVGPFGGVNQVGVANPPIFYNNIGTTPASIVSNITTTGFKISWTGTQNATAYRFPYRTAATGTDIYLIPTVQPVPPSTANGPVNATFSGLTPGSVFLWFRIEVDGCAPATTVPKTPYITANVSGVSLPGPPIIQNPLATSRSIQITIKNLNVASEGNRITTPRYTAVINNTETPILPYSVALGTFTSPTPDINNAVISNSLSPNTTYTVYINMYVSTIISSEQFVASSSPITVTTGPPQPVLNSPATNITSTGCTISWAEVSGATTYTFTQTPAAGTHTISGNSATFTGLTPVTAYSFTMTAKNSAGSSSTPSIPLSVRTFYTQPIVSVLGGNSRSVAMSITLPRSWTTVNKSVVTVWSVNGIEPRSSTGIIYGTAVLKPTDTTPSSLSVWPTNSINVPAAIPDTTYTLTLNMYGGYPSPYTSIQAALADGVAELYSRSAPISVTIGPPQPVLNSSATNITHNSFKITWNALPTAVNYTFLLNNIAPPNPPTVLQNSATFTGLTPSTTYSVIVTAINSAGSPSSQSNPISVVTLLPPPTQPVLAVSTAPTASSNNFRISWTGGTGTGTLTTAFTVSPTGPTTTNTSSPASFTGAVANTTYSITAITTSTTAGSSIPSAPLSITTAPATPVLDTSATNIVADGFTIGWTPLAGNATMTYTFTLNGAAPPVAPTISGNSATFTGLADDTNYSVTVVARNQSTISSPASAAVQVKTPMSLAKLQASSSLQQQDSSARQQGVSSALQQKDSSATQQAASSSVQQQDSSATQQGVSSALQQKASSAYQVFASSAQAKRARASGASTQKEALVIQLEDLRSNMQELIKLIKRRKPVYPVTTSSYQVIPDAATAASEAAKAYQAFAAVMKQILVINLLILDANPGYEDPLMQTLVPDAKLAAIGHTKKYDALHGKYIYYNSSGAVVANPFPAPPV